MSETAKNNLYLLGVLVLAVINLTVVFKYDLPAYGEFANSYSSYSDFKKQLDTVKKFASDLEKLNINVQALQNVQDRLSLFLPSSPNQDELVAAIDHITRISNFKVRSINFTLIDERRRTSSGTSGTTEELRPFRQIGINLNGEVDYSGLRALLESVEKSSRLLDVRNISVTAPDKKDSTTLGVTMTLAAYYQ